MKALLFFGLLATASIPTYAQTTKSANITNTATVVSDCTIRTTQNMLFPSVDLLTQDTATAQGSFGVRCTKGSYNIQISNGMNMNVGTMYNKVYSGSFTDPNRHTYYYECNRAMKHISGTDVLPYELYATSNMQSKSYNYTSTSSTTSPTRPTTCGTNNSFTTVAFTSFEEQQVNIYGKALVSKSLQSGAYIDTISVVVNF